MPLREPVQRIKAATVAIATLVGDGKDRRRPFSIIGSGFCIDSRGLVVTCRHVVDAFMTKPTLEGIKDTTGEKRPDGGEVLAPFGMRKMYAVFYKDISDSQIEAVLAPVTHGVNKTDHDLALLKIHLDTAKFPSGYPAVTVAEPEEISEGDEVGTCGFPLGDALTDKLGTVTSSFTRGIVSSIIPSAGAARRFIRGYQVDLGATHGNSGGSVFVWETGRVFGVLEGGVHTHVTRAAPLHHLLEGDIRETLIGAKSGELPPIT